MKKRVTTHFRSGHDDLDQQIRLLLTMLNELFTLYAKDAVGVSDPDLIDDQEQFVLGYFDRYRSEQEYAMERCRYPAAQKHSVHHRKFHVQLKDIFSTLRSSGEKRDRLRRFLDEFERLHVQTLDKDLARFQRIRQRPVEDLEALELMEPPSSVRRAIEIRRKRFD